MRGTEIRTFVAHDDLRLPTDPKNTTDLTLRMHEMRLRWAQLFVQGEIAAQLAELNAKIQPTTSAGLKLAKRVVEYFGNEEIDPQLDCDIEIRDMARAIVATERAL